MEQQKVVSIIDQTETRSIEATTFRGASLADAARLACEGIADTPITALSATPIGGTHYHIAYRDSEPERFWLAQLAHLMKDNQDYGFGDTEKEAY